MLKKSNRFLFLIMLLLTLALAACGAQNEDGTETGATPVTTIDSPDVNNGGSENGGTAAATPTTDTANLPPFLPLALVVAVAAAAWVAVVATHRLLILNPRPPWKVATA